MEVKGICKYCLGCNKLEDGNFIGTHRCKGFIPGQEDWDKRYREELKDENTSN